MHADDAKLLLETPTAEGLAALQRHWRATVSSEVAQVLEAVGQAFLALHPLPSPRGSAAFQRGWLEVAKAPSPLQVSWLAQTLLSQLPRAEKTRRADPLITIRGLQARVTALGALEADPRLAAALAQAMIDCPFALEFPRELNELFSPGFAQLTADGRQAAVLEQALKAPRARAGITRAALAEVLPPLIARCARVVSGLSAAEAQAWGALIAPAPTIPRLDDAELLRQLLEDERSDHPRQVYADALTERGDPRGEFITLQLSTERGSTALLKRQRALLKEHQEQWLGPLHRVFTHLVFHRGFLHEAALAHNAKVEPEVWDEALSAGELRFVRRLMQGRGSAAAYLRFLDAPSCQGVTELDVTDGAALEWLLERPAKPVRSLALRDAPSLEGLRQLASFSSLRSLAFAHLADAGFISNFTRSGLAERVRHLEVAGTQYARQLVGLLGQGALERVTFTAFHTCVSVSSGEAGLIVEGESEYDDLARAVLEACGWAQQVSLRVTASPGALPRLEWFEGWLSRHAARHVFEKVPRADGAGFHTRLRLSLWDAA